MSHFDIFSVISKMVQSSHLDYYVITMHFISKMKASV